MCNEYTIDLTRPACERWHLTEDQIKQSTELLNYYVSDIGNVVEMAKAAAKVIRPTISADIVAELESLGQQVGVPTDLVIVVHSYYDLVKTVMGCTAFAVEADHGLLHGRNLDWWTENDLLRSSTTAYRFIGAPAGEFVSIGWTGFAGIYSGVAPGRFAITMNSALSTEVMQIRTPVGFQIRKVFETAQTFDQAVEQLTNASLPCDCLLLISGCKPGEMAVIERSPQKSALRPPTNGQVIVTNNYIDLDVKEASFETEILQTSRDRFNRIQSLLVNRPNDIRSCLDYLNDPGVKMDITVQQMAFCAATGDFQLI